MTRLFSLKRVDIEKTRHRFVITSDVHRHILEVNRKAKEEWDKKQAEEAEKLRKVNEVSFIASFNVKLFILIDQAITCRSSRRK